MHFLLEQCLLDFDPEIIMGVDWSSLLAVHRIQQVPFILSGSSMPYLLCGRRSQSVYLLILTRCSRVLNL